MDVARGVSRSCVRGSLHAATACLSSVLSSSLSLFPSPHPHFLCTLSPFLPTICFPLPCSHLPSPPVFLCAFHPSSFHSIANLHLDMLPSVLIQFLALLLYSFFLLDALSAPLLQLGTVLLCQHQLPCFSGGAVNVSAVLWRSPNKRIFSFQLRDEEGLRCWPERSTLRWLSRLHAATSPV